MRHRSGWIELDGVIRAENREVDFVYGNVDHDSIPH